MCVITPTMFILGAIGLGGSAAASAYSAKRTGDLNEQSIAAQRESDAANRAAQLTAQANDLAAAKEKQTADLAMSQKSLDATTSSHSADLLAAAQAQGATFTEAERARQEDIAYKERARADALALDKSRYDAYVAANKPNWDAGAKIFGNLADLATAGMSPKGGLTPTPLPSRGMAAATAPLGLAAPMTAGAPAPMAATAPTSLLGLAKSSGAMLSAPATVDPVTGQPLASQRTVISSAPITSPLKPVSSSGGFSLMDYLKQVLSQPGGAALLNQTPAPTGVDLRVDH